MKILQTTALCSVFALAAAGPLAAMDKTLSGVEVKSNLSAYEDSNAIEFWPTLDEDLASAIASMVNVDDGAEAPRIVVEINKVAIDGDTVLPDSGEFNQLEGTVTTREWGDDTTTSSHGESIADQSGSYPLLLTAVSANREVPDDWILIPPSQDDFYNALINAYATEIVERVK